jgi:NAD(P)-dependent dehydrogenase (short-subunit alcohol dehydrogenase family)
VEECVADRRSLAGKVALVTGAARGIGRGIALSLAAAGAAVGVADLHPRPFRGERYHRLRQRWSGPEEDVPAVEAVRALGVGGTELRVDVSDSESVRAAVAACESELGPVDVLVNNAGIVNNIAPIESMSAEAWEQELRVNLSGAFHCIQATAPGMAVRGWGRVVNIASVAARAPTSGQPAYAASKAGLVALTQSTAQEFGRRGVTANAVLPGLIGTPLVMSMPEHLRETLVGQVPVGRLGEPEDIGELVSFLCSPAASFVTATAIPCDGGFLGAPLGGLDR